MAESPESLGEREPVRRRSLLGCGCGALVVAVLAVLVVMAWFAYHQGRRFEESLADPASRAARSREILGYDELPPGYHPMSGFSIPFVMEMAMISDRDPAPGETVEGAEDAFRERGFVFMKTRVDDDERRELDRFFAGELAETDFFAQTDLAFDAEERLGRGAVDVPPARVEYLVDRGRMHLGGVDRDELLARLLIRCPEGGRLRVAL
ncbi:MAG: hypothetical protein PVG07_08960, partial [Acidobacteriota bacterium]